MTREFVENIILCNDRCKCGFNPDCAEKLLGGAWKRARLSRVIFVTWKPAGDTGSVPDVIQGCSSLIRIFRIVLETGGSNTCIISNKIRERTSAGYGISIRRENPFAGLSESLFPGNGTTAFNGLILP